MLKLLLPLLFALPCSAREIQFNNPLWAAPFEVNLPDELSPRVHRRLASHLFAAMEIIESLAVSPTTLPNFFRGQRDRFGIRDKNFMIAFAPLDEVRQYFPEMKPETRQFGYLLPIDHDFHSMQMSVIIGSELVLSTPQHPRTSAEELVAMILTLTEAIGTFQKMLFINSVEDRAQLGPWEVAQWKVDLITRYMEAHSEMKDTAFFEALKASLRREQQKLEFTEQFVRTEAHKKCARIVN